MSVDTHVTTLSAAFDDYPHTLPLKRGEITSPRVAFTFSDIKPANRFFKPMVRELKFDVSEMAIATYVQAKAYGKPLVLIPATMMGRFQHGTILRNAARPLTPAELAGKRIGVRSYSQTTAVWVRGILENDYGVDLSKVRWVTFEDGHVAEYREPPGVERAGTDKNLLKMLREGELDAAIYGADLPNDPTLKSLIPDAETAAQTWYAGASRRADQPHGRGDGKARKIEPASGQGNLPAAVASQDRGRAAQGGRDRFSCLRPQGMPAGTADHHHLRAAAAAHSAKNRGRGAVRRYHPRARLRERFRQVYPVTSIERLPAAGERAGLAIVYRIRGASASRILRCRQVYRFCARAALISTGSIGKPGAA